MLLIERAIFVKRGLSRKKIIEADYNIYKGLIDIFNKTLHDMIDTNIIRIIL